MSNPRDRVTVDLRGLGPAVKAEAAARNLTLAAFSRAAIVESLRHRADESSSASGVSGNDGKSVKLTLRVPLAQARWLVEHARGAGLSYGTFLASVIDGAPCPGSGGGATWAIGTPDSSIPGRLMCSLGKAFTPSQPRIDPTACPPLHSTAAPALSSPQRVLRPTC